MSVTIKILNILATTFLAVMMLFGAYNHVFNPAFYDGFIPDFLPKLIVNYFSALIELIIGILLLTPKLRKFGALFFICLMVIFLPIHIWDLFKEIPSIGSKLAAVVRLIIQFVFIAIAYFVFKKSQKD